MSHLSPDELVDAVEQQLSPERQAHLRTCDACRQQVQDLTIVLSGISPVDVPEPSPLFWDRFSERVRTAIAAEPHVPGRVARWFQWPVLVPLGALAALLMALASAVPTTVERLGDDTAAVEALEPLPDSAGEEAHWELVAALVGEFDEEAAAQAGIGVAPGAADDAVSHLTAAEQEELMRLLRLELQGSGG